MKTLAGSPVGSRAARASLAVAAVVLAVVVGALQTGPSTAGAAQRSANDRDPARRSANDRPLNRQPEKAPHTDVRPPRAETPYVAGRAVFPVAPEGLQAFVGMSMNASRLRVLEVVGDRVAWMGTGRHRVLVHFAEGPRPDLKKGDAVRVGGIFRNLPPEGPAAFGVEGPDADTLIQHGAYVHALRGEVVK